MTPVDSETRLRVAIVGGGPAGLFTTYLLNQKYPQAEVVLFEASDRLGGKIFTDHFDDGTPFEGGVAELYEYKGPGADPLRYLIEEDLGLSTVQMSGGGVYLHNKLTRGHDEIAEVYGEKTCEAVRKFHRKMSELMPLEKFARRWQPENDHPWANKTFHDCIRQEIGDDPVACRYVEVAVHSDLATEPHTCNGLNGVKNVLLDNDEYMQLYHVRGGIERVADRLCEQINASVRFGCPVTKIARKGDAYRVSYRFRGEPESDRFDAVIIAMPNHWLGQIEFPDRSLAEAIHKVQAHYDLPAHYYRVSILFDEPFWERFKIPGDFWMMDMFNGCCCYNESARWRSHQGHVLSFLLAGQDALLQCSANRDCDFIVEELIDSLPDDLRCLARDHYQDAVVHSFAGSINAQPGGWPAEELVGEHHPEPKENPGVFLVGDYFFDSTLNACLVSANVATDLLLDQFGLKSETSGGVVAELGKTGAALAIGSGVA